MKVKIRYIGVLLILGAGIVLYIYSQRMKKAFQAETVLGLGRTEQISRDIITESDLKHLPPVVSKYLHYVGVVGKEKIHNMRVVLEGRIRSNPGEGWLTLRSEQYNFYDIPTRLFYIKASKFGIPAIGLHFYKNAKATFTVKLLGLIKLVDTQGEKLDQAETVTFFNDMCLLAPATLINENIQWEVVDALTVKANFTSGHVTIHATLFFNEKGELVNFSSNDRFETDGKSYKNYPWLTPVKGYKAINGFNLCSQVTTDTQRPDTTFSYGEFTIKEVEYNVRNKNPKKP